MRVAALIFGLLGGLFGLLVGVYGYGVMSVAGALGSVANYQTGQLVSIAIPISALAGGALSISAPAIGGVLMAASALGMLAVFGPNIFTAIPSSLTGLGALFAVIAAGQPVAQFDAANPSTVGQSSSTTGTRAYDRAKFDALVKYDPDICRR